MAEQLHCDACSEARPPTLRHVVPAYETRPGYVLEIDGLHWVHPVTHRHARCQIMTDVASRAPVITVFEETPGRNDKNNTTAEAKRSLLQDWMQHRGRPRLLRMDPDGAYMSNDMLKMLQEEIAIDTEVIPAEAPWRLSITGTISNLLKRTANALRLGSRAAGHV